MHECVCVRAAHAFLPNYDVLNNLCCMFGMLNDFWYLLLLNEFPPIYVYNMDKKVVCL